MPATKLFAGMARSYKFQLLFFRINNVLIIRVNP